MSDIIPSYDLISINDVSLPDVKKGSITIGRNPKYSEYDGEEGNKIIDIISEDKLKGNVTYSGLLQSEIQTIKGAISLVSKLVIYDPFAGQTRTFMALILIGDSDRIIHDETANAWTFSFDFEEIDYYISE